MRVNNFIFVNFVLIRNNNHAQSTAFSAIPVKSKFLKIEYNSSNFLQTIYKNWWKTQKSAFFKIKKKKQELTFWSFFCGHSCNWINFHCFIFYSFLLTLFLITLLLFLWFSFGCRISFGYFRWRFLNKSYVKLIILTQQFE